jgi:hypothetical protein
MLYFLNRQIPNSLRVFMYSASPYQINEWIIITNKWSNYYNLHITRLKLSNNNENNKSKVLQVY